MFDNANKRAILLFPKFKNIDVIQEIRKKYDRLYGLIEPHVTLIFPFSDSIPNELLIERVREVLGNVHKFNVTFKGISLSNDNNIFLNCTEGKDKIIELHDSIYQKVLPTHLKKEIPYIPHITLGQSESIDFLKNFNERFETTIDEISIEFIDENEKSILIDKIELLQKEIGR